jgi:hypothetical protein
MTRAFRVIAVTVDIGIDDRRNTSAFELLSQLYNPELGRLRPSLDSHLAALRIDTDGDMAGEFPAGLDHQCRIAHRNRAEDHPRQPARQPALDMIERANTAAELHRVLRRGQDRIDSRAIDACPRKGAVEVNDVQPFETLVLEGFRLRAGVWIVDGGLLHIAKLEANALAVLEVDGGK